jgi:hypothetical protein
LSAALSRVVRKYQVGDTFKQITFADTEEVGDDGNYHTVKEPISGWYPVTNWQIPSGVEVTLWHLQKKKHTSTAVAWLGYQISCQSSPNAGCPQGVKTLASVLSLGGSIPGEPGAVAGTLGGIVSVECNIASM